MKPRRRFRRRDPGSRALASLALVLGIACGSGDTRLVQAPVHRFALPAEGRGVVATAAVGGRVRSVLPGHPFAEGAFATQRGEWRLDPAAAVTPDERVAMQERGPVDVPANAVLEFGIGFAGRRPSAGPVSFEIDACRGQSCSRVFDARLEPEPEARWHDQRIALSELAGPGLAFRFRVRQRQTSAGGPSLPVWSSPTIYAPRPRGEGEPSLLLISIDTLRADHLGTYGYGLDTDPFLRRTFAGDGTVFESCISAASSTGPAHMTLFTALEPEVHGVLPTARFGTTLPEGVETLASVLRAAGFTTGAVTEDGPLGPARGFARGFDDFTETVEAGRTKTSGWIAHTLGLAESWLRRNGDKRFFLFVHTYEVHAPYTPPDAYAELFSDARPPPGILPEWSPILYDREIRHVDDRLRGFFAFLEEQQLLRDTVVVVTSDHGEAFLEHGFFGHGPDLHEEILRVPLMLRGPGIPAGRRVPETVGLVDLMPTLLELLGVPTPAGVTGRSAAGLVRGGGAADAWLPRPLYSGAWLSRAVVASGRAMSIPQPSIAVRDGDRKLIRRPTADGGFRYLYYDLAADPGEARPSSDVADGDAAALLSLVEAREAEVRRRRAALLRAAGDEPQELELEPAREERLRALGYLE